MWALTQQDKQTERVLLQSVNNKEQNIFLEHREKCCPQEIKIIPKNSQERTPCHS